MLPLKNDKRRSIPNNINTNKQTKKRFQTTTLRETKVTSCCTRGVYPHKLPEEDQKQQAMNSSGRSHHC
jgi:hypothetical protein